MTNKVLLSRPLPFPPLQFKGEAIETHVYSEVDADTCAGAQIYCSTVFDTVDAKCIAGLPDSIGLIANIGIGTDNVDLAAAKARGILVSNTPVGAADTADLAFALILSASRRMRVNEEFLRAGDWSETEPIAELGQSVHGKTLGILGFGTIGQTVARRASGFDMRVLYTGPNRKPEAEEKTGAKYQPDLKTFLSKIDILSLHCPLTQDTRHILNTETLAQMKKGAVIVNTGRGELIDEPALLAALNSGHIASAGLDVFETEPNPHPDFLPLNTLTLTPHMGSATQESRMEMAGRAIGNILAFFETGKPVDGVGG